jgi:hypothetical protein
MNINKDIQTFDFWNFEYVKRKSINEFHDICDTIPYFNIFSQYGDKFKIKLLVYYVELLLAQLDEFIDEDYFQLRNMVCAYNLLIHGKDHTAILDNIDDVQERAINDLLYLSSRYGYYPWNLISQINPEEIIKKILNNENFYSPIPFSNNKESLLRYISAIANESYKYSGSSSFINEFKVIPITLNSDRTLLSDDKRKKKLNAVECEIISREISLQKMEGKQPTQDDIQKFLKLRKKLDEIHFSYTSNMSRAIGLLLYDNSIDSNISIDDAISWFINTEIYSHINKIKYFPGNNPFIGDKEKSTIVRWVEITKNCIKEGKVISFKG